MIIDHMPLTAFERQNAIAYIYTSLVEREVGRMWGVWVNDRKSRFILFGNNKKTIVVVWTNAEIEPIIWVA